MEKKEKNKNVLIKNSFKEKNIKKIPIVKVNVSHITIIKIF